MRKIIKVRYYVYNICFTDEDVILYETFAFDSTLVTEFDLVCEKRSKVKEGFSYLSFNSLLTFHIENVLGI